MTSTQWPETRDGEQSSAFKVALSRRFFLFFFLHPTFAVLREFC